MSYCKLQFAYAFNQGLATFCLGAEIDKYNIFGFFGQK